MQETELQEQARTWIKKSTRNTRNQLLYLESRAVDYSGRVDLRRMNEDDFKLSDKMAEEGVIEWGRIIFKHINPQGSQWVKLTELGWTIAAMLRRARAERDWDKRTFMTTAEKQAA